MSAPPPRNALAVEPCYELMRMGSPYSGAATQGGGHFGAPGAAPYGGYYGPSDTQQIIDAEHLRLLRIGYFISAGQTAIFIPLGLFYAGMGVMMSHMPTHGSAAPPPEMFTWIFGAIGVTFTIMAVLGASLKLLTAIRLKERRSRVLCLITAGLSCLEMPYGTALGVMTFVVLGRGSVRQLFDE